MKVSLVAIAAVAAVATAAAAPASSMSPTLRVTSLDPVSVRGAHFQSWERVRVTLGSNGPALQARTTAQGTLAATFRDVAIERCDGYVVRANGSKGSRAVARARPLMCSSTNPG